jgi:hypothetical protein
MTEKLYCPKFIAALLPTLPLSTPYSDSLAKKLDDWMACRKEECGFFSKKHGACSMVAIADKAPLTVALDIPYEGTDVEGWDNK